MRAMLVVPPCPFFPLLRNGTLRFSELMSSKNKDYISQAPLQWYLTNGLQVGVSCPSLRGMTFREERLYSPPLLGGPVGLRTWKSEPGQVQAAEGAGRETKVRPSWPGEASDSCTGEGGNANPLV